MVDDPWIDDIRAEDFLMKLAVALQRYGSPPPRTEAPLAALAPRLRVEGCVLVHVWIHVCKNTGAADAGGRGIRRPARRGRLGGAQGGRRSQAPACSLAAQAVTKVYGVCV